MTTDQRATLKIDKDKHYALKTIALQERKTLSQIVDEMLDARIACGVKR